MVKIEQNLAFKYGKLSLTGENKLGGKIIRINEVIPSFITEVPVEFHTTDSVLKEKKEKSEGMK